MLETHVAAIVLDSFDLRLHDKKYQPPLPQPFYDISACSYISYLPNNKLLSQLFGKTL